jgi:hypothetical protein
MAVVEASVTKAMGVPLSGRASMAARDRLALQSSKACLSFGVQSMGCELLVRELARRECSGAWVAAA